MKDIENFEFIDRMSDSDALMWSIEKDPLLRSTIVTVSKAAWTTIGSVTRWTL